MERLSFDDAQILRLETEAIKGHTLKVLAVGPRPDGTPIGGAELRDSVAKRLDREPRARQRVVFAGAEGTDPEWARDDEFDLANHVVEVDAGGPVDSAGLLEVAGRLFEERLDHARPLWRADLVPMTDGGAAIVIRIHHALADGITSQRFAAALFWDADPAPEPGDDATPAPKREAPAPGTARRERSRWTRRAGEAARLPATLARELMPRRGSSALDRTIGARREVACAVLELGHLKEIAHRGSERLGSHVTLNDVLLALVAGGLRGWLDRGGGSAAALRAQVPVSLHGRAHDEGLGNRDSFLNVDLPIDVGDAFERLRLINAETARRKHEGDAQTLFDFFHALSRFQPLYRGVTRISSGPREFALSISNVPGPRAPVHVLGARASELFSIAEPADRHALRVCAISYADALTVGLASDPEAVSGIGGLAHAIEGAIPELAKTLS